MKLSILILAINEEENLKLLLPEVFQEAYRMTVPFEVIIVNGKSIDNTAEVARSLGCRVIDQTLPFYGGAMKEGLAAAKGEYILVLDADFSHPTSLIKNMWEGRKNSDIVIASRYVKGGSSDAPIIRQWMSIILNKVFTTILALPIKDISSGFRLYKRDAITPEDYFSVDFNILQEILITAYTNGHTVSEVPLNYEPRRAGVSNARIFKLSGFYLKTLYRLWKLRFLNSPKQIKKNLDKSNYVTSSADKEIVNL